MINIAPVVAIMTTMNYLEKEEKRKRKKQHQRQRFSRELVKSSIENESRCIKTSDGKIRRRYRWDEI